MQRILLLDDEPSILRALTRTLRHHFGKAVKCDICTSGEQALSLGGAHRYDVVISDLRMPEMDGMTFLSRFAVIQPDSVRMILTGTADFATAQRAVNQIGIHRYLAKPWAADELMVHVADALRHAELVQRRRDNANAWEASSHLISPQEAERRRLEAMEPGLTVVERDAHGFVLMPALE